MPADTVVGIAPHSLRATCPADLARALPLAAGAPVHIHIAEQPQEVADISAWLGARPVAWLLANIPVGPDWCAIFVEGHEGWAPKAALWGVEQGELVE